MQQTKILLDENDIPRKWYNILPDMPTQLSPPLNPATNDSYFSGNMFDESVKKEQRTLDSSKNFKKVLSNEGYAAHTPTPHKARCRFLMNPSKLNSFVSSKKDIN